MFKKLLTLLVATVGLVAQTAKFPTSLPDRKVLMPWSNRADTTLTSQLASDGTTINVVSTAEFTLGTGQAAVITIDNEFIRVCSKTDTTFTVCADGDGGRAFDGSSAAVHNSGAAVNGYVVADHLNRLQVEAAAMASEAFYKAPAQRSSAAHDFTAQAPGGTLTASVGAAVTLTPCPVGVAGADTGHYLYISGGTGSAEAVLITGGTCTSGATTGTIQFTPANDHSGAWTVASASDGVAEALCASPAAGGNVLIDAAVTLYANVGACGKTNVQVVKRPGIAITGAFTLLGADGFYELQGQTFSTGLQHIMVNPTLDTADYSFSTSRKGVAIDVVYDSGATQIGHGLQAQVLIDSTAPSGASAEGLQGIVRVERASEVYGVMGYVDWQNDSATGSGTAALTRGTIGATWQNKHGMSSVSETTGQPDSGLCITSSDPTNHFHRGVWVVSSSDAAFEGTVDASGYGLKLTNTAAAAGGVDTQVGISLIRSSWDDIGDAVSLEFRTTTPTSRVAAIAGVAYAGGAGALDIFAQTGSGDAMDNRVARFRGDQNVILGADSVVAADADLWNSSVTFALDESGHNFVVKVKYSTGVVKTASIPVS